MIVNPMLVDKNDHYIKIEMEAVMRWPANSQCAGLTILFEKNLLI
jgi:hypothetical protein